MKTLADEIRDIVGEARTRGMYPVVTDAAKDLLGRSGWSEEDEAELFTIIADRIERVYMELPMLEGEPLKVGDKVDGYNQTGAKVEAVMNDKMVVVRSTVKGAGGYHDEAYPLLLWCVDDLKRHRQEVLDAYDVPIKVGDVVWFVNGVERFDVLGIENAYVRIGMKDNTSIESFVYPFELTHRKPDTLERIDADAKKAYEGYWGCNLMISCEDCPAKVDGKKPHERYATGGDCMRAQYLDLMRRQREVLERGQR